jgi:hypothetical protein
MATAKCWCGRCYNTETTAAPEVLVRWARAIVGGEADAVQHGSGGATGRRGGHPRSVGPQATEQQQISNLASTFANTKVLLRFIDTLQEFWDLSLAEWNFRELLKKQLLKQHLESLLL